MSKLRRALNGYNSEVQFDKKYVYHHWDNGRYNLAQLGHKLDKTAWINEHVKNAKYVDDVDKMLRDWELYENGWLVVNYSNTQLFYYKCQIVTYGPTELKYLNC